MLALMNHTANAWPRKTRGSSGYNLEIPIFISFQSNNHTVQRSNCETMLAEYSGILSNTLCKTG